MGSTAPARHRQTADIMGNLRPETFAVINTYWSEVFGCAPHELWRGGTAIGAHHGPLAGYPGVYVLSARGTTRVSAPDELVGTLTGRLASAGGALLQPDSWREWFGRAVTQVLGPSIHHYLDDPAALGGAAEAGADDGKTDIRPLDGGDAGPLAALRAACQPEDWSASGFPEPADAAAEVPPVLFGAFRDGELVAATSLTEWRGRPADVGVLTQPAHRHAGLATRLAALAARHALDTAGLARYRAAVTNKPSLAIARRLGFAEYGRNLAVRLEP
jgi:hypothetical protein